MFYGVFTPAMFSVALLAQGTLAYLAQLPLFRAAPVRIVGGPLGSVAL